MRFGTWAAVVLATLLAGVGITVVSLQPRERNLTVMFARTTSLYEGAAVKVLGVKVGTVTDIKVKGTQVAVTMAYDPEVELPQDVHAMIVPPSLVGDRFVQLAPAYTSGPVLADDARLGVERSGVPLELDDSYAGLDKLAKGLGPEGANRDGALSRVIDSSAQALDGNGKAFNQTVTELSAALDTLATSSEDVSGTVTNLDTTTRTLAGNDEQVRTLVTALAAVGVQLNGRRADIRRAVQQLREALKLLATFVHDNRSELDRTITDLTAVTDQIDDNSDQLGQLVSLSPVGLSNLVDAIVPTNGDVESFAEMGPSARTGSLILRPGLLENLDVTLGSVLDSLCAQLPAQARTKISGVCSALRGAGGDLGTVLSDLVHSSPTDIVQLNQAPESMPGLLTGGVQ
ncbi:MCE family protein [Nocardioides sp. NPDC127514]|uniref:MCE family protein n=1 Tax=unclassified Nocardioides TaxID=2615069 RepID=UPI0033173CD9